MIGIVLALAAAEAMLRVTGIGLYAPRRAYYHFVGYPHDGVWSFDAAHPPEHIWDRDPYGRLPPGARMTYAINAAGLRGPLAAPGRDTVLIVGDSFTFGEGVPDESTFVARIDRALSARKSPPPPRRRERRDPGLRDRA